MRRYPGSDGLHAEYAVRGEAIRRRLADFRSIPVEGYCDELMYCLLTPQSSAVHADRAVIELREAGFPVLSEERIAAILRRPERYIRFHNTKAKRLVELAAMYATVDQRLRQSATEPDRWLLHGRDLREWLLSHVRGLGWKEASHFLRNIGYGNLAILDRHILRNLKRHGVIRTVPATLTPRRYQAIERAMHRFAENVGIPMDELDLLFWSRETGEIRK